MSGPIPNSVYVEYFNPELAHHRAWLRAVLERLVIHEPQALQEGGALRRLWAADQAAAGAASASVADIQAAVAVALPLVKEFEGCRRNAQQRALVAVGVSLPRSDRWRGSPPAASTTGDSGCPGACGNRAAP